MNTNTERNHASEAEVSASWNEGTTPHFTRLCENGIDNDGEISEDYLLGSQARPDPYSESQSQTEQTSNQITDPVLSNCNSTEGPCHSPNGTSFSSDSRTPSPSFLTSHDYHKHSGVDARDMSSNSAEPGISSGTRKSVKTPEITKDSSHTRTPSTQCSTSKVNLQASRLEDINMPSDASVSGSDQVDKNHDGVPSEEYVNDSQGDDKDDNDCGPITQDSDRIEPVVNDSDHGGDALISSDIFEDEADVSSEGNDSSPHSEISFNSEGSIEETSSSDGSSFIVNNNSHTSSISPRTTPKGKGSFRCHVCQKVYAYKHNLKRHVKLAHSSRVSQGIKRGKNDVQSTKESGRVFICKECSLSYSRKCDLVRHMNYNHKASDQNMNGNVEYALRSSRKDLLFRCREGRCTKRLPSSSLLKIHVRESHRDIERNNSGDSHEDLPDSALADYQDREESNRDNAEIESSPPSIESFYKCQMCAKPYFRKCDLTKHMKSKHKVQKGGQEESCYSGQHGTSVGQVYQCMECSQEFSTKRALANHVSEHRKDEDREENREAHALRPSSCPRYKCKICSKGFLKKAIRDMHEAECEEECNAVEEEVPATTKDVVYQCNICPKSYSRKCDLTKHMKRGKHPSRKSKSSAVFEDRFQCRKCSETFPNECSLTEHAENKHHDHERNDCDKNDADVVSQFEAFQKALSCRFCQITGLELIHRHERVCEQSPFLHFRLNPSKS